MEGPACQDDGVDDDNPDSHHDYDFVLLLLQLLPMMMVMILTIGHKDNDDEPAEWAFHAAVLVRRILEMRRTSWLILIGSSCIEACRGGQGLCNLYLIHKRYTSRVLQAVGPM